MHFLEYINDIKYAKTYLMDADTLLKRLGAQLQAAGVGQPDITEFPVHNEVRG